MFLDGKVIMVYVVNRLCITLLNNCIISEKYYMALLCRVVAAPSSSCVVAARWFLGIEEPLNKTENVTQQRELQREQSLEYVQPWAGLPQLGGEDNGQGWCGAQME